MIWIYGGLLWFVLAALNSWLCGRMMGDTEDGVAFGMMGVLFAPIATPLLLFLFAFAKGVSSRGGK